MLPELGFCDKRGRSKIHNEGGVIGVGPLWWQESAAANIILALNRALLDAHTKTGQGIGKKIYEEGFAFIQSLYDEEMVNSSKIKLEPGFLPMHNYKKEILNRFFNVVAESAGKIMVQNKHILKLPKNLWGTKYDIEENLGRNIYQIGTRLVPFSSLSTDRSGTPSKNVNRKLFNLLQVRDEVIKRYAMDIFTQLIGSARVLVYEHDPVLHDNIYPYLLRPPIIELSHFDQIGRYQHKVQIATEMGRFGKGSRVEKYTGDIY